MIQLFSRLTCQFALIFKERPKNEILKRHICRSFKIGKIVHISEIDWEDALLYAKNNADELMCIDDMISFDLYLNDKELKVLFAPIPTGGIYISAYDSNVNIKKERLFYVS